MSFRKSKVNNKKSMMEWLDNKIPKDLDTLLKSIDWNDFDKCNKQLDTVGIVFVTDKLDTLYKKGKQSSKYIITTNVNQDYTDSNTETTDVVLKMDANMIEDIKPLDSEKRESYVANLFLLKLGQRYLMHYNEKIKSFCTNVHGNIFKAYTSFIKSRCTPLHISDEHIDAVISYLHEQGITFAKGSYTYDYQNEPTFNEILGTLKDWVAKKESWKELWHNRP